MRIAIVIQPLRCKTFGPLWAAWPPIRESSPQCPRGVRPAINRRGGGGFRAALFMRHNRRVDHGSTNTSPSLLDNIPYLCWITYPLVACHFIDRVLRAGVQWWRWFLRYTAGSVFSR